MFTQGQKVIVLKSSEHRTGPRAGSVGFFTETKGYCFRNGSAFYKADVIFSRFGYERHERTERKTVVGVVPPLYLSPFVADFDPLKAVRHSIRLLPDGVKTRASIAGLFGLGAGTPFCVLGPLNSGSVSRNPTELIRWLLAVMSVSDVNNHLDLWELGDIDQEGKRKANVALVTSTRALLSERRFGDLRGMLQDENTMNDVLIATRMAMCTKHNTYMENMGFVQRIQSVANSQGRFAYGSWKWMDLLMKEVCHGLFKNDIAVIRNSLHRIPWDNDSPRELERRITSLKRTLVKLSYKVNAKN